MALSPKLQIIFEHLQVGEDVWDLCCDHGYLGWEALNSQKFENIHFVDRVSHIIEKLKLEITRETADGDSLKKAHFYVGDAEVLQKPLTGTVVIAGVGAYTAFSIIKTLWDRNLLQATKLIVSPQRDEQKLLRWLSEFDETFSHRYRLRSEQNVREGRRALWIYVCGQ